MIENAVQGRITVAEASTPLILLVNAWRNPSSGPCAWSKRRVGKVGRVPQRADGYKPTAASGLAKLHPWVDLAYQVGCVPLVFADALQHFCIRHVIDDSIDGQRSSHCLRVIKDDLKSHVPEIGALEALGYVETFRMRVAKPSIWTKARADFSESPSR